MFGRSPVSSTILRAGLGACLALATAACGGVTGTDVDGVVITPPPSSGGPNQSVSILSIVGGNEQSVLVNQIAGQRLEVQDGGGASDNFRIARTIGPGRYYLRIEGTGGDEGSYSLAVEED